MSRTAATYRICLLGEPGVGKTHWVRSLMGESEPTEPSKAADIHAFKAQTNRGEMMVEICDIPGRQLPFSPDQCLYGFSHGFAIVYNDRDSRAKVKNWARDVAFIIGEEAPAISVASEEMASLGFLETLLRTIRSDRQLKLNGLTPDAGDQRRHQAYQRELEQALTA